MHKTVLLLLLIILSLLTGCVTNPITGEKEFNFISESQEMQIGRQYAPEIEKQMGSKIKDPDIQNYIAGIGAKIVRVSHMPDRDFKFAALDHKSVNAMALPDGSIYITRGMLETMTSEAQLASVLAHEAVHVTARHVSLAMSKQIGFDLLLSIVASKTEMGTMSKTIANYGKQIISLRFSRDDEHEADVGGLDYMIKAGYNPNAFVEVMEILEKQSKTKPIEFLSSHPLPARRKEDLKMRIRNKRLSKNLMVGESEYKKNVLDKL
ncbi:MAG: M48 family metalloprotease [Planctomycetes bacterium]|nr:M48 family metalloprotease [Planctomycetota bacterium]